MNNKRNFVNLKSMLRFHQYLNVAVCPGDDVNAVPSLFIFKDTGIVLGCQYKEQVLTFSLHIKQKNSLAALQIKENRSSEHK